MLKGKYGSDLGGSLENVDLLLSNPLFPIPILCNLLLQQEGSVKFYPAIQECIRTRMPFPLPKQGEPVELSPARPKDIMGMPSLEGYLAFCVKKRKKENLYSAQLTEVELQKELEELEVIREELAMLLDEELEKEPSPEELQLLRPGHEERILAGVLAKLARGA